MFTHRYVLSSALIFLISLTAGCGDGGQPTVIAPDASVTEQADAEAFYNQAPEQEKLTQ